MAVTLDVELSPRKLDLIGVKGIIEILAEAGKVTRRGPRVGQPLSMSAVYQLTVRNSTFPKPWIARADRPLWRRADVLDWVPTWNQKDGPDGGSRRADLLVTVIDEEPDRIWTMRDLRIRVQKNKLFAESNDLRRSVFRTVDTVIRQGRIERAGRGRYRSLRAAEAQN